MENTVQHDWFATRLMNGDKDLTNLIADDIVPANSTLESPEFYKEKNKVKEIFTDDNGNFDDEKFNNFYNQMKLEYDYLKAIDTENYIYDMYQKSNADFTTDFGKAKDREMTVSQIANPQEQKYGIGQWNTWSDPELSKREAAQKNYYYNTETGQWSDKTVNELGALGLITGDSLVYATWDADGTHIDPLSGETVHHAKGDWKTDEWGNYYTETAGNKENLDKQFVTISEVLTDDEGAWNTIDVFDSDDINQNIPKTIARAAVTVAAMMTPWGSIGKTISLLTAAMQFARVMPQIGKTLTSFFNEDTEFDKLNSWDNYMRKFKRSTSDYSQEHSFSFESIMDMAISSFTQYAQQRVIAQIPQMFYGKAINDSYAEATIKELFKHNGEAQAFLLQNREVLNEVVKAGAGYRKTKELLDKAEKISTAVSRGYLIATSTEDVYREARNYGFDKQTSSVISLATYLGVWGLFSTDYFRGLLYNSSDYETKKKVDLLVKSYLKNNASKMAKDVVGANNETKKAVYKQWISSIGSFIKNHIAEVNAGEFGIMAGAVGEGLEEISEEVAQDLAFQIGQGWNKIKTLYTGKEYTTDYAYTKTNPLMRYATAGFGGALGGAIFKTADRLVYNKSAYKNWKEMLGNNDLAMKELVYYVSQGKTNQILASIDNLKKQSPLLSTDTSIFDGKKTSNVDETENEVLFSTFRKAITSLDTFINTNNLNIDQEVFADIDLGHGVKAAIVNAKGLQDSMFNDYQRRLERLADLNGQLEDLQAKNIPSLDDAAKADIASKITEKKKSIEEELNGVKRLINGEDDTYLGKLLLETNDHLRAAFINDKNALAQKYYTLNYEDLPEAYKQAVDTIYDRRVKSGSLELEYDKAWQLYSGLASDESLRNILQGIQGNYRSFNFDITDTADLNMARLDVEKGITNEDVVAELFQILKINSPDDLPDNMLRTIALSLLGIKSSPDIDLDVSDYDAINRLTKNLLIDIDKKTIEKYFEEIEAAYNEYVQNYQNKQFNMADDVKYVGNRYASLDTIRAVKNILTSIDLDTFSEGYGDFNIAIIASPINKLLQHIIDNKKSFKGIDISIVAELLNKLQQLGKDFVLSDTNIQQLTEILDLATVALSIVRSAYDKYTSELNGVPFGANNFMNSVFAEKKINKEFVQLNKDQVIGWVLELENFKHKIKNILDIGLANKKSIISEEKRLSLQYDQKRLTVIKSFLEDAPSYIKDGISIDLDDVVIDTNVLTEEQFIEVSAKYRNLLLSFERQFKDNWNNFDISTKEDLINKIAAFSRENTKDEHLRGDTSTLVLDKVSFAGTDFYYYLLGISISNTDLVNQLYRNYYDSIKDKVPFDSQEAVIVNALRFLTRDNNLEIWLKPIQSDIDKEPKESAAKFIHVCKNIMKILCKGGTGKSSTIIPGIYRSFRSHDTATKWIFAANTDDQLATLKQSIDDKSQTYCLVSSLINNLKDPTKREQYKDSIIVIDEATNIELDTWKELDEIGNQLNITFIAVGDDTQVGKPRNIDYLSGYQTPSLSETFRATSDINRFNTRTWDQIDFTSIDTLTPSPDAHFMYYEDDQTFDGIKFENQDLTVEYVVEFIKKYITDKSQRLLLFTDKDILSKLPKEIAESCVITSTTDYSRIQGAEWNYVLTDVDLSFDGDNTEQYKIKHRQNYTIFSRAKQGVVSFKPLVYKISDAKWVAKSVASKTKPIYTALTPDIVESFKKFKDAVHNLVKLNTLPKASSKPAPKPVTINTPVNSSIVQVSPAFVKQDENIAKLNISAQDLPNIRATLYLLATTNDENYKKQLPQHLQNGEFMITFVDANTDEFSTLGNVLRDNKNVKGLHPMLVYAIPINGEYVDIYLGMFHSPNNSKHVATTNATNVVWSLIEGTEEKDAINTRFKMPNITITRSTNPISIQNNESERDLQLTYDNGVLKPEASTFTMSSTPVVYFSSKQDSSFSHTADIIKASDELRTRYIDLWNLVSKKIPEQHLPLFADVIGYNRETKKYEAKGFSTLNKKFISFVQIGNSNLNSVKGLREASREYWGQLQDRIAHVNQLIDVLNQFNNTEDILRNCQAVLSNRGVWNTSVIVYSPTTTKDEGEIKDILDNLFRDENEKYYDEAIENQINTLVGRIGLAYFDKQKRNKTVRKFVDNLGIDTKILETVWQDCIQGNTHELNNDYYWKHEQIQKLITAAYAGGTDIEKTNTWKYDELPLKGHLYSGLLVKNSLPVINPTKQSAITTTGTFTVEGGKKVIQPAQIYVFVDDSVTSDNAKNVFIPIANTPSPFVDSKPVPIADPTSTPIVDPKPAQIADPKDDNETPSAKGTRIITELRKNFGVPIKTSIDPRNRDYIGKLSKEIIDLLLQLQEPTTNEAIDANNNIINEIKIKNVSTFPATMRVLVNILGKKKFPYNNKGNICK